MIELIGKHGFLIVGVVIGLLALGIFWQLIRTNSTGRPRSIGFLFFGPLKPWVDGYMSHSGGFTRRESIGWAVVVVFVFLVIIFKLVG